MQDGERRLLRDILRDWAQTSDVARSNKRRATYARRPIIDVTANRRKTQQDTNIELQNHEQRGHRRKIGSP